LTVAGHKVGSDTVGRLLHEHGFSLQANSKTLEGTGHPDRDAQFSYINEQAAGHLAAGDPAISVDSRRGVFRQGAPVAADPLAWNPSFVTAARISLRANLAGVGPLKPDAVGPTNLDKLGRSTASSPSVVQ
jgi:hypothetical protein